MTLPIPTPVEENPHALRRCTQCLFDVNHIEWKFCKKIGCAINFGEMNLCTTATGINRKPLGLSLANPPSSEPPPIPPQKMPFLLTRERKRAYIMSQGSHCPMCRTDVIFAGADADQPVDNKCTRLMGCEHGHWWYDVFTMSGVLSESQHRLLYPESVEEDKGPVATVTTIGQIAPIHNANPNTAIT